MMVALLRRTKSWIAHLLEQHAHIKIIRLKAGAGVEKDRYYSYQKKLVNFNIEKTDKVLDIGSGGIPFPLATHLADLHIGETSHRYERIALDDRPFVVCDIENMPFENKNFDFVYCSHVLEHVDHPDLACKEIMRIGKRGYIETPTKTSDIMFNFMKLENHHKWHIECLGNILVFMEWSADQRLDVGTSFFFEQYISNWENEFQKMIINNRRLFMNMFVWEGSFGYIVIDRSGKIIANVCPT